MYYFHTVYSCFGFKLNIETGLILAYLMVFSYGLQTAIYGYVGIIEG